MERCYKVKRDSELYKKYEFYYKNNGKVRKLLTEKVIEILGLNLKEEDSEYKIGLDQNWNFHLNHNFVKELGLGRKFSTCASSDIRDKKGEWLGVWSEVKKNTKFYKEYIKFLENYEEIDIQSVRKPFVVFSIGSHRFIKVKDDIFFLKDSDVDEKEKIYLVKDGGDWPCEWWIEKEHCEVVED